MRLLKYDQDGKVTLTKDLLNEDAIPPYAILSHTWGKEEVTFDELTDGSGDKKEGYKKIRFCMEQAAKDGIHHSWVDTCCIKKTDITELQHAINSMFRWYKEAVICYVFLTDVSSAKRKADSESCQQSWEPAFRDSRWFTRGWTLQELLAPRHLRFFSRGRIPLGSLFDLSDLVHSITNLPIAALKGATLDRFSVHERLSWTENRRTTREEDKAYSLLGIFGIFMPLIYGEGEENAFRRLQKEIRERRYVNQAYLGLSERDLACLQSLSFPEQEHRHKDIHRAVETCGWLLQDSKFNLWLRRSHGILWVKGDPGSGKSVLMKHAVRSARIRFPKELVVSYFIHGQGSELQKTPVGVYRALLNSLLGYFPTCLSKLATIFEDRESRFGGYNAGRWSWASDELQEVLTDLLVNHTQQHQVTIFVDALDECGERPARKLMADFGILSKLAFSQEAKVRICLSSRYYPILGIDDLPSISVEERNREDIKWFVNDRLHTLGSSPTRQRVLEEIMSKAQGGFQWALLVTDLIIDRKFSGRRVLGQVASCPSTLSDLYASLLNDGTEMEKRQAIKLFRWIIFARRPMSAQELREALVTDPDISCSSATELRNVEEWSETMEDFQRYVTYISRGLISFKKREFWEQWEESDHEAQLIHQSVADFLVEGFLIDEGMTSACAGHFLISRSCLKYLVLEDILDTSQQEREKLSSQFPLGPYAVRYVFEHIRHAEEAGLNQSDLLSAIRWSPRSKTMCQLANVWRILNPNNLGTPSGWPFIETSEIHVLAALGSRSALIASLQNYPGALHRQDTDGNTPLHIAINEGHTDLANLLLDWHSKRRDPHHMRDEHCGRSSSTSQDAMLLLLDAQNCDGETALDMAVTMTATTTVLRLVDNGASIQRMNQPHLLASFAMCTDDLALLRMLITKRVGLDRAIYDAVQNNIHCETFIELLKANASHERHSIHTNLQGDAPEFYSGGHALHLACHLGLKQKVGLMLEHGISATVLDRNGRRPLEVAVMATIASFVDSSIDHLQVVELLLRKAPTAVGFADKEGRTALEHAYLSKRAELVELLVRHGRYSGPNVWLTKFLLDNKIFYGIENGGHDQLLMNAIEGIDPSIQDGQGQTVLWQAVASGRKALVEHLVRNTTVNINTPDFHGVSPLLIAATKGHLNVAETLLSIRGIDVNTADRKRVTPLHAAVKNSDLRLVQLLLCVKGIDVNAEAEKGATPLSAAIRCRNVPLAQLLLRAPSLDLYSIYQPYQPSLVSTFRAMLHDPSLLDALISMDMVRSGSDPRQSLLRASLACEDSTLSASLLSLVEALAETTFGRGRLNERAQATLIAAIMADDEIVIKLVLSALEFDANTVGTSGFSILTQAIASMNTAIAKILVKAEKFDVNMIDAFGRTPLWTAFLYKHTEMTEFLLGIEAVDVNIPPGTEPFPSILWWAAHKPDWKDFKMLLATGRVDLTVPDADGEPMLLWAIRTQKNDVFDCLLETGRVDIYQEDHDGTSAVLYAQRQGHTELERLLEAYAQRFPAERPHV